MRTITSRALEKKLEVNPSTWKFFGTLVYWDNVSIVFPYTLLG